MDFKKLLGETSTTKEVDPLEIFKRLDKESGKEYLRPPQEVILSRWFSEFSEKKDVIIKLHTGQGKTLVGLLMLQSSINAGLGPAVYLCPNKILVRQTIKEAKSFGISFVEFAEESGGPPPLEFVNSEKILITTCNRLFNGKSVFGVSGSNREITKIGSIVMDDAHKCLDIIRETFSIKIPKKHEDAVHPVYQKLWALFEPALARQSLVKSIEIKENSDTYLVVPYWTWFEKIDDVLEILHKHKDDDRLKFVWDLIKTKIPYSTCIFSGKELEIIPRMIPVEMIPSFSEAKRRIFLSATLAEDAFLVRDLGIDATSVKDPIVFEQDKFSGERMLLIPTLVSPFLDREEIMDWVSKYSIKHGEFGVWALVPSGKHAEDWKKLHGGIVTNSQNLDAAIEELKKSINNQTSRTVTVLVNQYDGIDLPDGTCRILCLDSMPTHVSLNDRYMQEVRSNSNIIRRQTAQRIEQGMGRGIRGPSDYCVVIATGTKLTSFLSETIKSQFLSNEIKEQINIAKKLAEELKQEKEHKLWATEQLVDQCINRNAEWKEYYLRAMEKVERTPQNESFLNIFKLEREAESHFQNGQFQKASDSIQKIMDVSKDDAGWYLQLKANYLYPLDKSESQDRQIKAYEENDKLLRPEIGIKYSKLSNTSTSRERSIIEWINQHDSSTDLILKVRTILDDVSFGVESETFEEGIKQLGTILGFGSQRPEKLSKDGPDNLWNITGKQYWIISCKNMVDVNRQFISKSEAGQLGNDIAWFSQEYADCKGRLVLIHPKSVFNHDAHLDSKAYVITPTKLDQLRKNVQNFFQSLSEITKDSLTTDMVSKKLSESHLDILNINQDYFEVATRQN